MDFDGDLAAVVLVEGVSDQLAVEALARRRGRDLEAEGVLVVPIGGTKSIVRFLERYGPGGPDLRLAGLCDAGEAGDYLRGLERAGFGSDLTHEDMERLGFFVCDRDLEDELIRALGADVVVRIIESQGEGGRFRTFQQMPEKRGQALEAQLHRFMGTGSGRKGRYARRCSSTRSISNRCPVRSMASWRTSRRRSPDLTQSSRCRLRFVRFVARA